MAPTTTPLQVDTFPEVAPWLRSLTAAGRSPLTRRSYEITTRQLHTYLAEQGMPTDIEHIRREHLEAYVIHLAGRTRQDDGHEGQPIASATVHLQYRTLRAFFNWAVDEDYIRVSPMARMHAPRMDIKETTYPELDDLPGLFRTMAGPEFTERRDTAILHMFIATGMRLAELSRLKVNDLDLDDRSTQILGKGRRQRTIHWTDDCASAIDRYLVKRQRHADADLPNLWLGQHGPLTDRGIAQMVKRRGRQAGIELHPHALRHLFAATWLHNGGQLDELVEAGGWSNANMVHQRYGRATRAARVATHYDQFAPRVPRR